MPEAHAERVKRCPQDSGGSDTPSFSELCLYEHERGSLSQLIDQAHKQEGCILGRVVKLDRGYPLVVTEHNQAVRAEHAISLVKTEDIRAAIGDWVSVSEPDGHDKARIEKILPRRTRFVRWNGSATGDFQVLAANVDRVIIVSALSKKPLVESVVVRILKGIVIARDAGCDVAVVLSKADRKRAHDEVQRDVSYLKALLGDDVPMVVTSALNKQGISEVEELIEPGRSAVLLGESGAGKSTLANTLLDDEVLATGAVRSKDDKGRHTTVARQMTVLANGGILIDAPGLRTIPLIGHEEGMRATFPAIEEARLSCRFRDCTHVDEPGCEVLALVERGVISAEQLRFYRLLAEEMRAAEKRLNPNVDIRGGRAKR